MPGTHCYAPECLNRINGHVINDHIQGKKQLRFSSAKLVLRYVVTQT